MAGASGHSSSRSSSKTWSDSNSQRRRSSSGRDGEGRKKRSKRESNQKRHDGHEGTSADHRQEDGPTGHTSFQAEQSNVAQSSAVYPQSPECYTTDASHTNSGQNDSKGAGASASGSQWSPTSSRGGTAGSFRDYYPDERPSGRQMAGDKIKSQTHDYVATQASSRQTVPSQGDERLSWEEQQLIFAAPHLPSPGSTAGPVGYAGHQYPPYIDPHDLQDGCF